jgi:ABC-2 type transport system permease protein
MLTYFVAPLYLIIPMMVSAVIAADSLAGERERKTIEALVYTPTTDFELYVAKLLAAWLPALAVGLFGFVLYSVAANVAAWPTMGRIFLPNLMWVLMAFWVGPAAAGLGLGAMVLVSSRVASFQEANQLGGMVVLPVIVLLVAQGAGVMYLSAEMAVLLGLVLWVIDACLIYFGQRLFRRGQILARA